MVHITIFSLTLWFICGKEQLNLEIITMSVLVSSYADTNYNVAYILKGSTIAIGQSFIATNGKLDSAKFLMAKGGSPTGNAYAKLYRHSGLYGTDSTPLGVEIATSGAIDVSTFSSFATLTVEEFSFTGENKVELVSGVPYIIAVEYEGGTDEDYVLAGADSTSPTATGNRCYHIYSEGSSDYWNEHVESDLCFWVYKEDSPSVGIGYGLPSFVNV